MDTMHLTGRGSFHYVIQGHYSLPYCLEFKRLGKETRQAIGNWIFQDILCRWGTLIEIVSDNGKPFIVVLSYMEQKYHMKHIRISGYNLHTNRIVERSHFDVQQALFKASDGAEGKWAQVAYLVFWSEQI